MTGCHQIVPSQTQRLVCPGNPALLVAVPGGGAAGRQMAPSPTAPEPLRAPAPNFPSHLRSEKYSLSVLSGGWEVWGCRFFPAMGPSPSWEALGK